MGIVYLGRNSRQRLDIAEVLPELDAAIFSQYYEDKWSIFTQSLLTNHEKAELFAQNLAESIFDEHILEDMQAEIKYKLSKTIQST
ncbi:hypothetical protein SCFA_440003 [anaerobic digester metagenome]|uniref:Uncharacterized protein n=1 Tax=anaerobic digester metagenome TaxID=1263854 RepID=A0A485M6I5_9ZZZZ